MNFWNLELACWQAGFNIWNLNFSEVSADRAGDLRRSRFRRIERGE
jgi:hypothetical protein